MENQNLNDPSKEVQPNTIKHRQTNLPMKKLLLKFVEREDHMFMNERR